MFKSEDDSSKANTNVFGDRAFKAAPLPSTGGIQTIDICSTKGMFVHLFVFLYSGCEFQFPSDLVL